MSRFVLMLMVCMALVACGVKSDLTKPNGNPTPADEQDPSKPPHTIGQ
jgi:predicted small lipoprotein YifL